MKPHGPIPAGYTAIDGELAVGGRKASALVKEAGGTPLFVYSRSLLEQRMADLRAAMPPALKIHYAMKANPHPAVLEVMADLVDGLDVASGGELAMARAAGFLPREISFAGPGKRDAELLAAVKAGVTLNLESAAEARRALEAGLACGTAPRLAIRVNPEFELRGSGMKMGGGAKPFGVDEDQVASLARTIIAEGCDWRGLHIYAGSQALDAAAISDAQGNALATAARLTAEICTPLPHLNLGGGYGIPYFDKDKPLDIAAVGARLQDLLDDHRNDLQGTEFAIELGRYLVGGAGVYLTRIVDIKTSKGVTFWVTDGGMHHQLAASGNFGAVVRRNYPVALASRFDAPGEVEVNVVGCLCTPLDRLADDVLLPQAQVGDVVAVFCAGAYGASASPAQFLGQGPAREMLV
ncbi:pyridoxal-dependent decarboxylase, exosortase A system-associated [Alteraurantiacibacter buctensis]|uniref:Pyridoxal-dependent decarboxylase, exosortase A system-associated n=1 Tax=Alteraurantiacibacter buctensis TaxID=1503981 RepID=A0A844YZZ8_9SPHN|nr:pyridoxal-dependent decarboxylase, exosortase A system-associated [Alteraurantiacibacter buctensis]MXO72331.1 pyridoxal-dependent decarboxylase, exosortase A system-associated [Alteraurantiacibacter buctensis]